MYLKSIFAILCVCGSLVIYVHVEYTLKESISLKLVRFMWLHITYLLRRYITRTVNKGIVMSVVGRLSLMMSIVDDFIEKT